MYDEEYYKQMIEANSCSHENLDVFDSEYMICTDCGQLIPRPNPRGEY